MGILEKSLEEDIVRQNRAQTKSSTFPSVPDPLRQQEAYSEEEDEHTKGLRSSVFAREDAAYYEDEEGDDDIVDLGIALGKVRITERIGGLVRPKFSDELGQALRELPKREPQDPASSLISAVDWMMPSSEYVAPSSSFFFTPGAEKTTLMNYLPAKVLVDRLIAHYWQAVHVIARTVHRPSFERHYDRFWKSVASGIEPRNSFQAVVFAALLSSVVSMSNEKVLAEFGVDKQALVDNFREATEAALSRANLLRTTKLETLQAFVMYLARPRPQIRPDDYDTRLPLNIDDIDLDRAEQGDRSIDIENDRPYFTDMTITRMRFECYDMHRYLWVERPKLERKRKEGENIVSINTLLARVQSFKAAMEATYVPMLSKTAPLHALASQIYGILSNRLYIHVLQKYLSSDRHKMPDRLRQIVLSAAIMTLEHSQNIEQQPVLSTWAWYVGALHQYHTALLILNEMYALPYTPALEQRAWRVLDFVFGLGPDMTNTEKTRTVLEELMNKMQVYQSVKRWRAPKDMPQAGPRTFTPGFQQQQQAAEERARHGSLQFAAGASQQSPVHNVLPADAQMSPPLQQTLRPPRLSHSQSRQNEIDQLFGGAETGTGNVMIPPFTFPQFSATDLNDLQWPPDGYQ
ncbi:hypothetical protein N0V87_002026 [Didymella glomerata]|uniref:Uncharacterized protein n=1 Tax=Didymella glomerata TaxID=749621 RepID=A0A9W8X4M3_9PLEO|nr:hypothetical protein N0V87_002026 [Didymella glomerata]